MNNTDEYLNGNGHGTGEHKKVFTLAPAGEDMNAKAPRLRHAARTDPDLSDGAKVLFDHLTDQSFLDSVSPARGVVKMSKKKLAEHLHCSERTISRHCVELERKRFIWTKTVWMGGFELTLWYIRGMADSQTEFWNNGADPSWGSAKTGTRRFTARGENGQFCPHGEGEPESTETPTMSAEAGQECPPTTDKIDRHQRTNLTGDNGQNCPSSTDKIDRHRRTELTGDNGQNCPKTTDKIDRPPRTEVSGFKETQGASSQRSESKAIIRVGNRAVAASGKETTPRLSARERDSENDWLTHCEQVLGKAEMKENGGLWRSIFRTGNRTTLWKCLNEVRSMKLENRIKKNAAATMMDLWKGERLGPSQRLPKEVEA